MTEPAPDRPTLDITAARVVCKYHGEPLRPRWPRGYATFASSVLQHAFVSIAKELKIKPGQVEAFDPAKIEGALDEIPACCRTPDDALLKIYADAKVGRSRRCKVCGHARRGTPYRLRLIDLRADRPASVTEQTVSHCCFHCVIRLARQKH